MNPETNVPPCPTGSRPTQAVRISSPPCSNTTSASASTKGNTRTSRIVRQRRLDQGGGGQDPRPPRALAADHAEGKGRGLLSLSRPSVEARLARLMAVPSLTCVVVLTGCFTDAATRLACDLRPPRVEWAQPTVRTTRWCTAYRRTRGSASTLPDPGRTASVRSSSRARMRAAPRCPAGTTYHARFVDTPQTSIIDKPAKDSVVFRTRAARRPRRDRCRSIRPGVRRRRRAHASGGILTTRRTCWPPR